jgi:putative transposase
MHKAFVYRLYPTKGQAEQLTQTLDRCRELYNAALEERREAYRMAGKSLGYCDQAGELPSLKETCPAYKQVGSQVLQDVLRRVDRAFAAFFRRVKAGHKPGHPRFRGRDRYDSFTYTQAGWKVADGRLVLAGIGALKVKWSRPIAGTIKTVTIRRSTEQWSVCFSCVVALDQPLAPDRPAVGLDVGLEHFATLSTGEHIPNPRPLRRSSRPRPPPTGAGPQEARRHQPAPGQAVGGQSAPQGPGPAARLPPQGGPHSCAGVRRHCR